MPAVLTEPQRGALARAFGRGPVREHNDLATAYLMGASGAGASGGRGGAQAITWRVRKGERYRVIVGGNTDLGPGSYGGGGKGGTGPAGNGSPGGGRSE
ncbi:MAG TPA: hypothetical protein VGE72_05080, partial [Azospirillum sp.]